MERKICLIYNYAQHYRSNIFTLMDKELCCDFVFGDKMDDVKKMDYSLLSHFKKEVQNKIFVINPFYYQSHVLSLLKEDYTSYLILGELFCVSTWLMLFGSKLYGKNIYLWSHGWYGKEGYIRKILKRFFFSMAEGTFLYGNYAKELMIQEGLNADKLHVIYNSLAYDEQIEIRKSLKMNNKYSEYFGNNFYNLIFVGRLNYSKRLDLLLDALVILKAQFKHFNLTLIGDGDQKEKLMALTKQLGLKDNVWFYGECYDEKELSVLIFNADLCVSPGNVGLTAMHAMVFGTPVLTHNNLLHQGPEFEAINYPKTGIFFEYENCQSLADKIITWFEVMPDREQVRKNCYEVIDTRYNPHVQLETFKKHLK